MPAPGRKYKLNNGMTPKQNAFKDILIEQLETTGEMNATEAAVQVYDTKNRNVANNIASENLAKPIIKDAIEAALAGAGVNEAKILENINRLASAQGYKLTGDTVLKANLSILRLMGHDVSGKDGKNRIKVTRKVETMGYSDAKKELQTLTIEQTEFIDEVERI